MCILRCKISVRKTHSKNYTSCLNFRRKYGISVLNNILEALPTAELEPLQAGQLAQLDEVDMGMTYKELSVFGRLRKQSKAGPFTMFCRLVHMWDHCTPKEVSVRFSSKILVQSRLLSFK